jgi:dihydroneopterin aldolase
MTGTLDLRGIVLRLKLGALGIEKISERDVPVDLSWRGSTEKGRVMDYALVCNELASLQDREYDYIEELAEDILGLLLREFPGGRWRVTVRKPFPPADLKIECASFTVEGGENG